MSNRSASLGLLVSALAFSMTALAQDPYGPGVAPMGVGGPPPAQSGEPKPSDLPETHAASGATDSIVPEGNEPALPEDPLKVSDKTRALIGTDLDLSDVPQGMGERTEQIGRAHV